MFIRLTPRGRTGVNKHAWKQHSGGGGGLSEHAADGGWRFRTGFTLTERFLSAANRILQR